ncbi:D-TA family PLP-dependent enzyme [Robiginitalea sp. IMCC44478]|uniref:D-TA family PLP-dependent enzyme n=1 Tax=Robiginitalea sp. IMCC44478 TaxID=3459122 RepID=UPI004042C211
MKQAGKKWYALSHPEAQISPSLLIYPDRIKHNIDKMLEIAGSAARLRPHIKTHKMAEIIRMQQQAGISKFKCATLAEAELLGRCEAGDVLVAYPLVGPGPERFLQIQKAYPRTRYSCLVDHFHTLERLHKLAEKKADSFEVFLDLNVGMNRTGIAPGKTAFELYAALCKDPFVHPRGLHIYDGHLRNPDPLKRTAECDQVFAAVLDLKDQLKKAGFPVDTVIAGGSPSFPIHARRKEVELSPGTTLLWDARYASSFPEMPFLAAATVLCRLISKPSEDILCLDLGHKALAAEMPFPRAVIPGLEGATQISQSEEHLVLRTEKASNFDIGQEFYAIPMHICPTVIKYPRAGVVVNAEVTDHWEIAARDYQLSL